MHNFFNVKIFTFTYSTFCEQILRSLMLWGLMQAAWFRNVGITLKKVPDFIQPRGKGRATECGSGYLRPRDVGATNQRQAAS